MNLEHLLDLDMKATKKSYKNDFVWYRVHTVSPDFIQHLVKMGKGNGNELMWLKPVWLKGKNLALY